MDLTRAKSRHRRILGSADKAAAPEWEPDTSIPVRPGTGSGALARGLASFLAIALATSGCATAPDPASPGGSPGASGTPAYVQTIQADQVDTWRGVHYDGLVLDIRQPGEWE